MKRSGITVTEADLGRSVVYRAHDGARGEDGTIIAYNLTYIFVRYGSERNAKATHPERLEWTS